jgi:hypothetical protein
MTLRFHYCYCLVYSMLIFINTNFYNCSCDYLYSFCVVCSFVCCVSLDCGVILCDVCYLFVVSYCITTATG